MAESRYIKLVKNTTVLSIDEYGRHRDTPYSTEVLFDILDARYQRANLYTNAAHDKKLTLLASNLPVEELEPWLQSRLHDRNSVIVDMSNLPDRRDN
jgi:DNA replication protein DnaC